ncbi:hypothetical protein HDV05_002835 [Chytridiales sp. JEL 0842]|nr:hypothetical protein HDV05_002835 [Chytridiales sp. JEL 0842]
MAMNFGPEWMRKIPAVGGDVGRASPTLTQAPPLPAASAWGAGAPKAWASVANPPAATVGTRSQPAPANAVPAPSPTVTVPPASKDNNSIAAAGDQSNSARFRYTKEFILSLYNPNLKPPADFDPVPGLTVTDTLEPLANVPFSEQEKKLLAMPSVNSEIGNRKPNFREGDRAGGDVGRGGAIGGGRGGRMNNRRPFEGTRAPGGERQGGFNRGREGNDLWDMPNRNASDSHNDSYTRGDGDDEDKMASGRNRSPVKGGLAAKAPDAKPGPIATPVSIAIGTTQLGNIASSGAIASPVRQMSTSSLSSESHFSDIFNKFSLPGDSVLDQNMAPRNVMNTAAAPLENPPIRNSLSQENLGHPFGAGMVAAPIVPSTWYYQDPSGMVQGPFTAEQMHEWYLKNFFSDDLPVRRDKDISFEPLGRILLRFGTERPFFAIEEQTAAPVGRFDAPRGGGGFDRFAQDLGGASLGNFGGFGGYNGGIAGQLQGQQMGMRGYGQTPIGGDPYLNRRDLVFGGIEPAVGQFGTGWGETQGIARPGWVPPPNDPSNFGGRFGNQGLGGQFRNAPTNLLNGMIDVGQLGVAPTTIDQPGYSAFANPLGTNPLLGNMIRPTSEARNIGLEPSTTQVPATAQVAWSSQPVPSEQQQPAVAEEEQSRSPVKPVAKEEKVEPNRRSPSPKRAPAEAPKSPIRSPKREVEKVPKDDQAEERLTLGDDFAKLNVSQGTHVSPTKPVSPAKAQPGPETENQKPPNTPLVKQKKTKKEEKGSVEAQPQATSKASAIEAKPTSAKKPKAEAPVSAPSDTKKEEEAQAPPKPVWTTESNVPKLSLKEIQEIEEKKRKEVEEERARKAREAMLAQAQALAEQESGSGWNSGAAGGVWGATPKPVVKAKSTLADIMLEEEKRKQAEAAANAAVAASSGAGAAPTTGVKKYADSITANLNGASWAASTAAKVAGATRPVVVAAVGATRPSVSPSISVASSAVSTAAPAASNDSWSVVGGKGGVRASPTSAAPVRPGASPATATSVPISTTAAPRAAPKASAPPTSKDYTNGPSDPFMQWCRQALRPLERSTTSGVNVDDFVGILYTIPLNDSFTTFSICDDTLGGLTAIDPRKFAEEFMRRRKADVASGSGGSEGGWTSVGGSAAPAGAIPGGTFKSFESTNSFTVVGQKAKNKKKK